MDATAENLYFSNMATATTRRRAPARAAAIPAFSLYGEPPRPPDAGTVHVETIASRSRVYNWSIRAHRHRDLCQMFVVYRGEARIRIDDRLVHVRGPMVVIVPPGAVHSLSLDRDISGIVATFSTALGCGLLDSAPELAALLDEPAVVAVGGGLPEAAEVRRLGEIMLRESNRHARGREAALRGLLCALVANVLRLIRDQDVPASRAGARNREIVARFRRGVERRFQLQRPLASYARDIGCTETALRRACRMVSGLSPLEMVHQRVLAEAQRLLRYTGTPIAQVAFKLGFDDPAYFSRFFAKRMRISPRAFRNRAGADPRGAADL
ncbi:MAG: helix-turn-helix domain-containing protein [Gammaproteobacteria bacterium]|nr:helix-turn-helix domain-containing protein [Gammaproteobacteria bacterium]